MCWGKRGLLKYQDTVFNSQYITHVSLKGAFPLFSVSGGLIIESPLWFPSFFTQGKQGAEWHTREQSCWTACWRGQPAGGGSSADSAFSLANQCSTLPGHATAATQAQIPNDGLLRPQEPHMGFLGVKKEPRVDRHTYSHPPQWRNWGFQLARRHWQCISHRGTWMKSEPDKSRVLSGLCPACSCHLLG